MNILFLDSIDTATFGGYENWIRLASNWLADHGHTCTIAGRPGSEYLRRLGESSDKLHILELPIGGDFDPRTINRLRNYLSEHRVDIMTVNFNKDIRIGGLAARWSRRTRVVWRIGLDITQNRFIHRLLTPRLVDAVFVPSEGLRKQVTRFGYLTDEMVRVIHTGLEPVANGPSRQDARARLHATYELAESDLVAVSSGRFVDQKGHTYLVDAIAQVVQETSSIRFLWLGNGPLERDLKAKAERLGVREYIIFAGMLDSTAAELAGSDFMVHSAVDEPFSHAVLEGMRAGLPLVATDVGGTPEAVEIEKTGLLVPIRDPQALAAAILRTAGDAQLRQAFGAAGRKRWEEHFTVDRMMSDVLALFDRVRCGDAYGTA